MNTPETPLNRRPRKRRKLRAVAALSALFLAVCAGIVGLVWSGSWWWLLLPAVTAAVTHRFLYRPGAVPVFTFHSVSDAPDWLPWAPDISLGSDLFARMLQTLADTGCRVVPTRELVACRREGRPLPARSVVLHFDDGYLDNWVAALPYLKRHGMPATLFVSLDFIDPGAELRPSLDTEDPSDARPLQWDGYLNRAELAAMEATGLIDVQSHGTDHGRVAVGPRVVGELTAANWRNLAWLQWAAVPGNKSRWYLEQEPAAVPLGSPVPENLPSLTARRWLDGRRESEQEYRDRVSAEFQRCRRELGEMLGKPVDLFCWPQNHTTPRARELALQAGFAATTGGWFENRPGEDPSLISRIHVGKDVLGLPCTAADAFYFRAQVAVGLGNYYWYPALMLCQATRSMVRLATKLLQRG